MSQSSSQSLEEQYAAALASKLSGVLDELESDESDSTVEAPNAAAEGPEQSRRAASAKARAPRVSRKEARAKLELRLESIPGFDRHSRKCQICNHPEIEDIEDEFINWASARWIKKAFKLNGESTIYRHARATGLDAVRRENLSMVVEKVLQEVDHVEAPTVAEVLRGVRILARLNGRGEWVFPPGAENSNRQTYEKLEIGPTHTKKTTEVISNRQY